MKKSSTVKSLHVNEEKSKKTPVVDFDLKAVNLQEVIKLGLQDFFFEVGMIAVQQTMAAEVATLAGPRYARQTGNDLQRWGNQQGLVYVNGQKVNLSKPRVVRKSANKHEEVELETYKAFSKPTAMNEAVMAKMLAGVSTRDYAGTVEAVLDGHGVSRSAVSRRSIRESGKALQEFYTRRLKIENLW